MNASDIQDTVEDELGHDVAGVIVSQDRWTYRVVGLPDGGMDDLPSEIGGYQLAPVKSDVD